MFAKAGAKLALAGRNEEKLKEIVKKCGELSKTKVSVIVIEKETIFHDNSRLFASKR